MTIKLFEEDVYIKESICKIEEIIEREDKILLVLDRTIFFPIGGGQPSDLGMIGESNVLSVFEKDNIIYHEVDNIPEKKEVKCILDWERRLDHMQQHCGEHILSGIIYKEYGFHNKGFHLGEDHVTIDIDAKELTLEMILNIETKANEAIYENRNISINTVKTSEEAQKYHPRKIPETDQDLRIVIVDDIDCCACCGTHPLTTGEVGVIKILKVQKYKKMSRIFFKCGKRALENYQLEHDIITSLNRKYSSEITTLLDKIEKEELKNKDIKEQLNTYKLQLSEHEALSIISDKEDTIEKIYEDKSVEEINMIIDKIFENESHVVIMSSLKELKIIFAHDGEYNIECGKIFKKYIKDYNGRGGGNNLKAQGAFTNTEDMIKFVNCLKDII